jgi:ATP-dependent protease ClpP protease subunit
MTTIDLSGVIGWEVTANDFRRQLAAATGDVQVRIHSPGGDVIEGIDIANAIRAHRRAGHAVEAYVSGQCMSMATYIASVCDAVEVEDNAVYMIHNPWGLAIGDYRDMAKAEEVFSGLTRVIAAAYAERTERRIDVVRQEMDAETWLFGSEIVSAGFADRVTAAGDGPDDRVNALAVARASWSSVRAKMKERDAPASERIAAMLSMSASIPEDSPMSDTDTSTDTVPDPVAPEAAPEAAETVDVQAAIAAALAAERARIQAITERCAAVKMPELTAGLVASGASIEQANAAIVDAWSAAGGADIRTAKPEGTPGVDAKAVARSIFEQVANGGATK